MAVARYKYRVVNVTAQEAYTLPKNETSYPAPNPETYCSSKLFNSTPTQPSLSNAHAGSALFVPSSSRFGSVVGYLPSSLPRRCGRRGVIFPWPSPPLPVVS